MKKTDFDKFRIGTIFNECVVSAAPIIQAQEIIIDYPIRLEAMALDPSQIANNDNLVYRAGQIDVTVPLFKRITVKISNDNNIAITSSILRPTLVRHAAKLMQKALNLSDGLIIDVVDTVNLRHCGLGSSSATIAGVACAINEIYGNPIHPQDLVKYLAQNHGEEIDNDMDHLMPVQCIGGSAVCGNFEGGLIVLAGEATPIAQMKIGREYSVVIGVPNDFEHPDAGQLMQAEIDNMHGFERTGVQYGNEIAYRLVHQVLPELREGKLNAVGDLIFDYRWNMGSIKNCSFAFPRTLEIAEQLRSTYHMGSGEILALSSVGPGFFAVTKEPDRLVAKFKANNMAVIVTTVHNGKYVVIKLDAKS